MTNKDFAAVARLVAPSLPGFAIKAPLMVIPPLKHTLRGLCFESHSREAKLFYVWVFFLPLCVPTKHVSFNLGKRIGSAGDKPWNADAPNLVAELSTALKREALPFLSHIESPLDLAHAAKSLGNAQDPYAQQAIAYAFALAGDVNKAAVALDELTRLLDVKVPWQLEMLERANALKSQLYSDVSKAQSQLEAWGAESIRNLSLEKFR